MDPAPAPAPAPSGEFLDFQIAVAGRYSLERELGRGGMGIVFLARDVALDRPVAIKLLPPEMARQPALRDRFLREARTAAKLSHPNVIPIFAVEDLGEHVFFVMAYVEGLTLGQRVSRNGPLPPAEAMRILREVAWALAYAHAQGVVHRDVKPDNILLEDGSGRALVTDFGIAQVSEADSGLESEVLGTPQFMSPEQAAGEPVDGRSDLYSLGVTAFYILAGKPLFDAPSSSEILAHHIGTPAPSLISVAPGVPTRLAAIVEQCLAKDPDDRMQRGELMAEALAGALEVRKQTPVAVRLFVKEARERQERGHHFLYPVLASTAIPLFLTGDATLQVVGTGIVALSLSAPLLSVVRRLRRVIKAGYGQDDITQSFQDDLVARHEELRFVYGEGYERTHRIMRNVAYGAVGTFVLGFMMMPVYASPGLMATTIGAALVATITAWHSDRRSDKQARGRVKFWRGRVGRWLFSLAGVGLDARDLPTSLTNRPTEIAIGMAVSSLFRSLPKATRDSMDDLPDVVAHLGADAHRLRSQVDEFDALLAVAEEGGTSGSHAAGDPLAEQRHRAAERIREARDEAQKRFSQTVAALETLRIDLLRMRAGTVNLASVTANLGTARQLGAQIDRLLKAHREIEDDLKPSLTGEHARVQRKT